MPTHKSQSSDNGKNNKKNNKNKILLCLLRWMGHGWGGVNEDSSTQVDKPSPISKRAQSERVFTAYHWAL